MTGAATGVAPAVRLDEDSLRQILELLGRRFGSRFRESMLDLVRSRLTRRLIEIGVEDLRDYYYRMLYDPAGDVEVEALFDTLANHETYFFREDSQIWSLVDDVLPERLARSPDRIRVWSAGCATGEEPYSLAIAFLEKQPAAIGRVEIFGSDQSARALEKARGGVYSAFSFRSTPPALRDRWFSTEAAGRWRVNADVRRHVQFGRCNLVGQAGDLPLVRFDAIFCRNVLIYLDREARRRVVEMFHDRLATGGYLFLGHSETLLDLSDRFEFVTLPHELAYRK